jgi:hypothetical protein
MLIAGALLLLISFTTNCGDDNLFHVGRPPAPHQIGMGPTLPPWRRLLAYTQSSPQELLNWRPVDDIEQGRGSSRSHRSNVRRA